jgi:hypothetical protein
MRPALPVGAQEIGSNNANRYRRVSCLGEKTSDVDRRARGPSRPPVWPVDTSAPADGTAVEAASGASGSASEATTGSSDTLDIDVSEDPAHPVYDGYCVLEVD